MIIYDCEIKRAILKKGEKKRQDIEYCAGWHDHSNMGISVICAYDYEEDRYRVFCDDNISDFQDLVGATNIIVGFNSLAFDNKLCLAHNIVISASKSYDLLVEAWRGAGLGETFQYPSHLGFGLDDICSVNFGINKSGHGAQAPVQWQKGQIGAVIDYCINDVKLTKTLLDHVIQTEKILDPRNSTETLIIRPPNHDD